MIFKNHRTEYFSFRAVTTHANAPQDLRGYRTKVYQICSHSHFSTDGVNATIRIVICPPIVK